MFSSQLSHLLCQQFTLLNNFSIQRSAFNDKSVKKARSAGSHKEKKKERCLYLLSVTAASPQALGLFEDIVTEPNKMTQAALKRW